MYKIRWVGMIGNSGYLSGYVEPYEYLDSEKDKADKDAKSFNKKYPGVTHYVIRVDDD